MKKRILPVTLALVLAVSLLQVCAFAAVTTPTTPGLNIYGVGYSEQESISDYTPKESTYKLFDVNGYVTSATFTAPRTAKYLVFRWWDHGEAAVGQGWLTLTGKTYYDLNGGYAPTIPSGGEGSDDTYLNPGNALRAIRKYVVVEADSFNMVNGETFTIKQVRADKLNAQHTYTIKFTINWTGSATKPIPSAPTGVAYQNLTHQLSGLYTSMEMRCYTNTWSNWDTVATSNMYPYLSTNRSTTVQVRYKETSTNAASESWSYTIPALAAAPIGLYIDWYSGVPAIWGLDSSRYYVISKTSDFSTCYTMGPGYSAALLDGMGLTAGSIIYVRSAANANASSFTSMYAAVSVPSQVTPPSALYDKPSSTLYGLYNTMDFQLGFPSGLSGWMQVPYNNAYFNAYPYLSTDYNLQIQVRYRSTPTAMQTIVVPALEDAPDGLSFEWIGDSDLILWGFEPNNYYGLWTDSNFENWYDYDGTYSGLNVSVLNLQPGDKFYVRVAPNDATYPSACVELTVPSKAVSATSAIEAFSATIEEATETVIDEQVAELQLNSLVAPDGNALDLDSLLVADESVAIAASANTMLEADDETAFGTLELFTAESNGELIISTEEVSAE